MPFGSDANDLPLQHFQEDMNKGLRLGLESMKLNCSQGYSLCTP